MDSKVGGLGYGTKKKVGYGGGGGGNSVGGGGGGGIPPS